MIKILQQDNLQKVINIAKENFTDELDSTLLLIDSFGDENYLFLGGFCGRVLTSYLIANIGLDDICIVSIATRHCFQHKGYAKELLEYLIDFAQDKTISLEVKETNSIAISLYEAFGFKTLNVRKKYYKDGTNALCMFRPANIDKK